MITSSTMISRWSMYKPRLQPRQFTKCIENNFHLSGITLSSMQIKFIKSGRIQPKPIYFLTTKICNLPPQGHKNEEKESFLLSVAGRKNSQINKTTNTPHNIYTQLLSTVKTLYIQRASMENPTSLMILPKVITPFFHTFTPILSATYINIRKYQHVNYGIEKQQSHGRIDSRQINGSKLHHMVGRVSDLDLSIPL